VPTTDSSGEIEQRHGRKQPFWYVLPSTKL
jgi:hypothetical protein